MPPHTRKKEKSMASKPRGNGSTEPQSTSSQAETGKALVGHPACDEEPMYNFAVPAVLKARIDHIVRAGKPPQRGRKLWPKAAKW